MKYWFYSCISYNSVNIIIIDWKSCYIWDKIIYNGNKSHKKYLLNFLKICGNVFYSGRHQLQLLFKYCIFSCSSTPQISLERGSKLSFFTVHPLSPQARKVQLGNQFRSSYRQLYKYFFKLVTRPFLIHRLSSGSHFCRTSSRCRSRYHREDF